MPRSNTNRIIKSTAAVSKINNQKRPRTSKASSAQNLNRALATPASTTTNSDAMPGDASSAKTVDEASQPVYFWKPNQNNGYLGQWYESQWTHEGDTYVTAEMWMMVGKARLFGDEVIAKAMLETTDPKSHKALGRKVSNFDEKVWNAEKLKIVEEGNYLKFTTAKNAEEMRALLLATGERELVEASPMDRIWGIGFGEKNAGERRAKWGQNLLGKALMNVRARLREEAKEKKKE